MFEIFLPLTEIKIAVFKSQLTLTVSMIISPLPVINNLTINRIFGIYSLTMFEILIKISFIRIPVIKNYLALSLFQVIRELTLVD